MKRVHNKVYIVVFAITVLCTSTSCTKDFTCTCTYHAQGKNVTNTYPLEGLTKKDAKNECKSFETDLNGIGAETTCNL